MELNKKGFTLVELLIVIVIISLVIGLSVFGVIRAIDASRDKTEYVSEASLFEAARVYSSETDSHMWKNAGDYDAFCVTIGELMNKGLIDENDDLNRDEFIIVKRNKVTLAIEKEEMANVVDSENYEICTGESVASGETVVKPIIGSSIEYTDKLVINFTPGSAKYYNGDTEIDSEVSYDCLYGDSSSTVNRVGDIVGNQCIIDNLKNNKDYYAIIYMNTNNGTTVMADGDKNYKTSDFKNTSMSSSDKTINITFYDNDTNGNGISNPSHYFKSSVNGTSNVDVKSCVLDGDIFNCSSSTRSIENDIWYKVDGTTVDISYTINSGSIDLTTRIYDGSNNFKQNTSIFSLKTLTVKFYRNGADSIGGSTSDYVTRTCSTIASSGSGGSCSITSPDIEKSGWTIVGWNTSSSGTSNEWNVGTSMTISSDASYYAVTKKTLKATFDKNGATSIGSTSESCDVYNTGTSCSVTSPVITRNGYTIVGWNTSNSATSSSWTAGESKSISADVKYYAITSKKVTITFNGNGGTAGSSSKECTIYNGSSSCSITMPSASRNNYDFNGWSTSSSSSSGSYYSGTSYNFSDSDTLYAIWKSKATFGDAYGYEEFKSIYTMYVWHYGSKCKTRNQSAYDCDGTRCAGCSENYCETVGTITSGAKFYYVDINWDLTTTEYVSLIVYIKESEFNWKGPGLTGTSSIFGSCATDYITYGGVKYHRGIIPARCNASGCSTYQCHTTATIDGYCKVCPNGTAIPENWSC